jgi:cell division protein FtsW (lipid II flippase)
MAAKKKNKSRVKQKQQSVPHLLAWVVATVAVGFIILALIQVSRGVLPDVHYMLPFAAYAGVVMLSHLILTAAGFKGDRVLPAVLFLLCGIGLIFQFRLGGYQPENMLRYGNIAFYAGLLMVPVIILIFRRERYLVLKHTGILAAIVSIGLMSAILVLGHRYRGMVFMPGNINPSEPVKLLMVIFLAGFMTSNSKKLEQSSWGIPAPPPGTLLMLAVLWLIPMGLLVMQRDFGMIAQLNVILLVIWIVATGHWSILFIGAVTIGFCGFLIAKLGIHGTQRITTWLMPFADPTGAGWQVLQSLSAIFSGGLFGSGLGVGMHQAVPIANSDFVYAVIGEELGYIGCGLLLMLYILFFARGVSIMRQTKDPFAQLLAAGLITSLTIQTLLNIGGVIKAVPLTGVTLPFISHGGSSLAVSLMMTAILLAISDKPATPQKRRKPKKKR